MHYVIIAAAVAALLAFTFTHMPECGDSIMVGGMLVAGCR